jgi:hypothetical protein
MMSTTMLLLCLKHYRVCVVRFKIYVTPGTLGLYVADHPYLDCLENFKLTIFELRSVQEERVDYVIRREINLLEYSCYT